LRRPRIRPRGLRWLSPEPRRRPSSRHRRRKSGAPRRAQELLRFRRRPGVLAIGATPASSAVPPSTGTGGRPPLSSSVRAGFALKIDASAARPGLLPEKKNIQHKPLRHRRRPMMDRDVCPRGWDPYKGGGLAAVNSGWMRARSAGGSRNFRASWRSVDILLLGGALRPPEPPKTGPLF